MEIIIKALLTGAVFAYIGYITRKEAVAGKLFYSRWIIWLGVAGLAIVGSALYALLTGQIRDELGQYIAAGLLAVTFLTVAIACFLEYKITSGKYDDKGISLRTPWSGYKKCKWSDVEKVKYNDNMHWYVFYCKNGQKMRFSSYLTGIDEFIYFADKMLDKGKK